MGLHEKGHLKSMASMVGPVRTQSTDHCLRVIDLRKFAPAQSLQLNFRRAASDRVIPQ